ncbi:MAG: oligosaccharide biosynthesis protein Alg14 [Actinomycetales bacterium]|nr:oligosaccharide biosynthesis protein Alg14 [Actinomycetales bacterium]MCP4893329.1 oligosaccharide biosynthesis protein Alg14 [Actinomycetales bacterium]
MSNRRRILAVASSGGHWIQLRRMSPAFPVGETTWVSTSPGHRNEVLPDAFRMVPDCNRWDKVAVLKSALKMAWVVMRLRPTHVVTTGAAPGYFAIFFSKLLGARTLWIDSVANAEELSMSGSKARGTANEVWSQWPELATPATDGLVEVGHHGSVL